VNKVASYLQEHIVGEVLSSARVRKYFSTDGGIFEVTPSMIVYPKNVSDVRKVTRFSWQLSEKGHVLPITARGRGSDQSGAAIGKGIVMVFPAHMNRLLELDTKQRLARVQPGLNYLSFEQAVHTHGLFLPPYPASLDYATLGGAIANNSAGEKSVKYGDTRRYIEGLEVVLADGELIQTGRLSKRDLNRKKGLTNFEGEVYRQLDGLISDNWELIQQHAEVPGITKNSAGYALGQVKRKDGSFDLTPLFVGSQGTLGIVTEAIVKLESYTPKTTLMVVCFDDLSEATSAVAELLKLEPSALEMVDKNLLETIGRISPNRLKGLIEPPYPELVLLCEFDDDGERKQSGKAKRAEKLLKNYRTNYKVSDDYEEQQKLWSIRHSAAALIAHADDAMRAVPIIEDGIVPRDRLQEFITEIYALFKKYHLDVAIWGHAGDANLHLQPFLDLARIGDRQKVFKIMDEYYDMVLRLGGSTAGEHNDGRVRGPYLPKVFGAEMYQLFQEVKHIFDPHNMFNPGVKIDVDRDETAKQLRHEYSMDHLADHLPRT
jgi:FAD/FMN-containing dehydrogenase